MATTLAVLVLIVLLAPPALFLAYAAWHMLAGLCRVARGFDE